MAASLEKACTDFWDLGLLCEIVTWSMNPHRSHVDCIYGCQPGNSLHRFLEFCAHEWGPDLVDEPPHITCGLYIWLPAWEKSAEIFGVLGLLYEMVDLPTDAQLHTILNALQLLF